MSLIRRPITVKWAMLVVTVIACTVVLALAGAWVVRAIRTATSTTDQAQSAPRPGDCNADGVVTSADIAAISQRMFNGVFGGNQGCDANYDLKVDAGDLICARLLVDNGPDACGVASPEIVAPALDLTVGTDLGTATQFLYTGYNPIQRDVAATTIDQQRVAVLRGRVLDRAGSPVEGVRIDILQHPEFGYTLTREDGWFDLAVNGGGWLVVRYSKNGLLAIQRQVDVPWLDFAPLPEAVMIPASASVAVVDFTANTAMQVVAGPTVQDSNGSRAQNLLIPQGTTATMQLRAGGTRQLTQMHVRTTEYTVGDTGPSAMPADLPANSGYTYAVNFSVDEVIADGVAVNGKDVTFNQPILMYTDNFRNFKVGTPMPAGYYDFDRGVWVAENSGLVIKILSVTNAKTDLDLDGSGAPASAAALSALGVTDAERETLAVLYSPGHSLWRIPSTHLSTWDDNKGTGPIPPNAETPKVSPPADPIVECPRTQPGSVIECETQVLGERIDIAGTPFSLNYRSSRQPGYSVVSTLRVPVTGATLPPGIQRVALRVDIAGRVFVWDYAPATNITQDVPWDGLDVYGRRVQGLQPATVVVGYGYGIEYVYTGRFGYNGSPTLGIDTASGYFWLRNIRRMAISHYNELDFGLGAWSLNVHHVLHRSQRAVFYGDGSQRRNDASASDIIETVAGNGAFGFGPDNPSPATQVSLSDVRGVAVAPDGTMYLSGNCRIWKVTPDGTLSRVVGLTAGGQLCGSPVEGSLAVNSQIRFMADVEVDRDGTLYFSDLQSGRIYKVPADGKIYIVAGLTGGAFAGDGGPARTATLNQPWGLDIGPDGSLYVADSFNNRVRRIGTDGIITTVAGNGVAGFSGDGGPAVLARLDQPYGIDAAVDGNLYIADRGNHRIRRVGPDGQIVTVAGTGFAAGGGDGGLATQAGLFAPTDVAVAQDGSVYIVDSNNRRIRLLTTEGLIETVAGTGAGGLSGNGGPATLAQIQTPGAIVIGPDLALYIADTGNYSVRRVTSAMPGVGAGDILVADPGGEVVHTFSVAGRHKNTLDAVTGALLYSFQYDSAARLISITDGDGNVTTVTRDANGKPTGIVGPYGQRTDFELDSAGYLTRVINPAAEPTQFTYAAGGLLSTMTDARGGQHQYAYDDDGRLIRDENPAGGVKTLARLESGRSFTVSVGTRLDATRVYSTQYQVTRNPAVPEERRVTWPEGLSTVSSLKGDVARTDVSPSGVQESQQNGPDPRWGMLGLFTSNATVQMSPGLQLTLAAGRSVVPAGSTNPFSKTSQTRTQTINGRTTTSLFNVASRQITETSAASRVLNTAVDSQRRPISVQLSGLSPLTIAYDGRGRLTSMTQGSGLSARTQQLTYSSDGYLDTVTDAVGRIARFGHDLVGRTVSLDLPGNRTVAMAYDQNGNVTSLTPPGRTAHTFTYTPADQVSSYTPPSVNGQDDTTSYAYNFDRQLQRVDRPDGRSIALSYDNSGRIVSRTIAGGTANYTYGPTTGLLTSVSDPSGVNVAYSYIGELLAAETWSGPIAKSITYAYDSDFRIASSTVAGTAAVTFQYDADSLLTRAGDVNLSRNAQNGLLTGSTLGGVVDTWAYNGFAEPTTYAATYNSAPLYNVQYTRDNLGRISQRVESIGGITDTYAYSYDLAGRLSEVTKNGAAVEHYTYDSNSNRLTFIGPDDTVNGTYDAQDRMLTYGGATFAYTGNGELLTKTTTAQTTTYDYDELGNLRGVDLPGNAQIDYLVDGVDRRIGKKVNGALVQGFVYDGQLRPLVELDGSGNVVSRFVYATRVNVPDYLIRSGVTYRLLTDHLGSPRLVVDTATGAVAQRMDYDAFGRVLADTNPGFQPFGFAGGLYDRDTGLVRFGMRDYDAESGRWTAKDPLGLGATVSLYTYAENDPQNTYDLDGNCPDESAPTDYTALNWKNVKKWFKSGVESTWTATKKLFEWKEKVDKVKDPIDKILDTKKQLENAEAIKNAGFNWRDARKEQEKNFGKPDQVKADAANKGFYETELNKNLGIIKEKAGEFNGTSVNP